MNLFLTATDTGAGKTYAAASLIRRLRARGVDAVGFKPICCGSREDAEILRAAAGAAPDAPDLNAVNPVWLRAPAAPYAAAMIENRLVDLALVREAYAALRARHEAVIVEGVGGWLVPVTRDYSMADLAAEFALPVVAVVRNRLGALNHAALTVGRIRADGLQCLGLISTTVRLPSARRKSIRKRSPWRQIAPCSKTSWACRCSAKSDQGRKRNGPERKCQPVYFYATVV